MSLDENLYPNTAFTSGEDVYVTSGKVTGQGSTEAEALTAANTSWDQIYGGCPEDVVSKPPSNTPNYNYVEGPTGGVYTHHIVPIVKTRIATTDGLCFEKPTYDENVLAVRGVGDEFPTTDCELQFTETNSINNFLEMERCSTPTISVAFDIEFHGWCDPQGPHGTSTEKCAGVDVSYDETETTNPMHYLRLADMGDGFTEFDQVGSYYYYFGGKGQPTEAPCQTLDDQYGGPGFRIERTADGEWKIGVNYHEIFNHCQASSWFDDDVIDQVSNCGWADCESYGGNFPGDYENVYHDFSLGHATQWSAPTGCSFIQGTWEHDFALPYVHVGTPSGTDNVCCYTDNNGTVTSNCSNGNDPEWYFRLTIKKIIIDELNNDWVADGQNCTAGDIPLPAICNRTTAEGPLPGVPLVEEIQSMPMHLPSSSWAAGNTGYNARHHYTQRASLSATHAQTCCQNGTKFWLWHGGDTLTEANAGMDQLANNYLALGYIYTGYSSSNVVTNGSCTSLHLPFPSCASSFAALPEWSAHDSTGSAKWWDYGDIVKFRNQSTDPWQCYQCFVTHPVWKNHSSTGQIMPQGGLKPWPSWAGSSTFYWESLQCHCSSVSPTPFVMSSLSALTEDEELIEYSDFVGFGNTRHKPRLNRPMSTRGNNRRQTKVVCIGNQCQRLYRKEIPLGGRAGYKPIQPPVGWGPWKPIGPWGRTTRVLPPYTSCSPSGSSSCISATPFPPLSSTPSWCARVWRELCLNRSDHPSCSLPSSSYSSTDCLSSPVTVNWPSNPPTVCQWWHGTGSVSTDSGIIHVDIQNVPQWLTFVATRVNKNKFNFQLGWPLPLPGIYNFILTVTDECNNTFAYQYPYTIDCSSWSLTPTVSSSQSSECVCSWIIPTPLTPSCSPSGNSLCSSDSPSSSSESSSSWHSSSHHSSSWHSSSSSSSVSSSSVSSSSVSSSLSSASPSQSFSRSPSASFSPSPSQSFSPSPSQLFSPSSSQSFSTSPSQSFSPSSSQSFSTSPSQSFSPSSNGSPSNSPSASPSNSPSASPSNSPSASPSNSPSTSPSNSPSASLSNSPSASPSNSPSTSASPSLSSFWSPAGSWHSSSECSLRKTYFPAVGSSSYILTVICGPTVPPVPSPSCSPSGSSSCSADPSWIICSSSISPQPPPSPFPPPPSWTPSPCSPTVSGSSSSLCSNVLSYSRMKARWRCKDCITGADVFVAHHPLLGSGIPGTGRYPHWEYVGSRVYSGGQLLRLGEIYFTCFMPAGLSCITPDDCNTQPVYPCGVYETWFPSMLWAYEYLPDGRIQYMFLNDCEWLGMDYAGSYAGDTTSFGPHTNSSPWQGAGPETETFGGFPITGAHGGGATCGFTGYYGPLIPKHSELVDLKHCCGNSSFSSRSSVPCSDEWGACGWEQATYDAQGNKVGTGIHGCQQTTFAGCGVLARNPGVYKTYFQGEGTVCTGAIKGVNVAPSACLGACCPSVPAGTSSDYYGCLQTTLTECTQAGGSWMGAFHPCVYGNSQRACPSPSTSPSASPSTSPSTTPSPPSSSSPSTSFSTSPSQSFSTSPSQSFSPSSNGSPSNSPSTSPSNSPSASPSNSPSASFSPSPVECCQSNTNFWVAGTALTEAQASQIAIANYMVGYYQLGYVRTGRWSKTAAPVMTSSTSANMWYVNMLTINVVYDCCGLWAQHTCGWSCVATGWGGYCRLSLAPPGRHQLVYSKVPYNGETHMAICGVDLCFKINSPVRRMAYPPWAIDSYPTIHADNTIWYGNPTECDYVTAGRAFFMPGESSGLNGSECKECLDEAHSSVGCGDYPIDPCRGGGEPAAGTTLLLECCQLDPSPALNCPSSPSIGSPLPGRSDSSCSLASNAATISPAVVSGDNCNPIQQTFTITDKDGIKAINYAGLAYGATITGTWVPGDQSASFDYSWPSPEPRRNAILSFEVQDVCDNMTYLSVLFNVASSSCSASPSGGGGAGGTDILVQDCITAGGAGQYYCSDPTNVNPQVGGVVLVAGLGGGGTKYCGTVISLTAVGAPTHQLDANFQDCNACAPYSGGPFIKSDMVEIHNLPPHHAPTPFTDGSCCGPNCESSLSTSFSSEAFPSHVTVGSSSSAVWLYGETTRTTLTVTQNKYKEAWILDFNPEFDRWDDPLTEQCSLYTICCSPQAAWRMSSNYHHNDVVIVHCFSSCFNDGYAGSLTAWTANANYSCNETVRADNVLPSNLASNPLTEQGGTP